ncbi:MAG: hypothetical protein LAT67_01005 [Balneolales bacterium]|nr:hypothetical protein [Balneolales bacterium]
MKRTLIILLLASPLFLAGCYTQLETIERDRGSQRAAGHGYTSVDNAYDSHYAYDDYVQGYYDGVFDANLSFREYNHSRFHSSLGFHWGRPGFAFGYGYSHFYDPFWHYYQLYDPFYFSLYGFYGHSRHHRFHRYSHFYSPWGWGGFGHSNVVIFNNFYGSGSSGSSIVRGPRNNGIHRGNVTSNRTSGIAGRGLDRQDNRTRQRGFVAPGANRTDLRPGSSRGVNPPASVDRRRNAPAPAVNRGNTNTRSPQASPQRPRSGNNSGTVNRGRSSSGNSSSGTANRNRGGNNQSSGTVNRNRGNNNSSSSSNNRNRNRDNNNLQDDSISMMKEVPLKGNLLKINLT